MANLAETTKTTPAHTAVSLQNLNSVFFDDGDDDYDTDNGTLREYTIVTNPEDTVTLSY